MSLIIIILGFYGVFKLFSLTSAKVREKARQAQIERIKREQAAQREEMRRAQEEAKAEAKRVAALEREQERIAKEQERQAAQLAKHEEEIAKLKFAVAKAQFDIEHYNQQLEDLNESLELATNTALFWRSKGDAKKEEQAKRKIVTLRNQIYTAETRIGKAQFAQKQAQSKLSA